MRPILLTLILASPSCAGWGIQNLTLYERPEDSHDFYEVRGVPMFVAEARMDHLWNGVSLALLVSQECAWSNWSDYLQGPGGPRQWWCRGGEARAEFDLVLDSPMTLQWELWRSPETQVRLEGAVVPNPVWEPVSSFLALGAGTYHLYSRAWAIDQQDQDVRIKITTPVPEPSTLVIVTITFLGMIAAFVLGRRGTGR